jgi:hypothetical protein
LWDHTEGVEHLITAIQAGCREAVVFSGFSDASIGMGIAAVKAVYRRFGLPDPIAIGWDVFDGELDDRGKGFFERRLEVLSGVIRVANKAYSNNRAANFERERVYSSG